jgi:hypothetical protein
MYLFQRIFVNCHFLSMRLVVYCISKFLTYLLLLRHSSCACILFFVAFSQVMSNLFL